MTSGNPQHEHDRAALDRVAMDRAARIIAQALMEAEVILAAERDARAQQIPPVLVETLEKFSDILAQLVAHTEQLATRMSELSVAVAALGDARPAAPPAPAPKPQVQSAAVRRYQDDEAAIQLVLSQPMTASAIAEGVSAATSKQLIVDDSRPESLRLRLRFLG